MLLHGSFDRLFVVGIVAAALCASCDSLKQPYPDKSYFGIDLGTPGAAPTSGASVASVPVILVRRLAVSSPYDEPLFVYKTGANKVETDYYNAFISEPASLLTGDLLNYLSRELYAASIITAGSGAHHDLTLEGSITSLYADLQIKNAPRVVIEARFMLIDDRKHDVIVFDKSYSVAAPAARNTPSSLAAAWGVAYHQLLDSLAGDLRHRAE